MRLLPLAIAWGGAGIAVGSEGEPQGPQPAAVVAAASGESDRYTLVEEFTAATLAEGEVKIGTELEVGLTGSLMIGTDLISTAVGATTIQGKATVFRTSEHLIAVGMRAAYLSKSTFLWGSVDEHFQELDARIVRPSISWTNTLSPRLKLHTFWGKGFGKVHAKLSEKGQRKLWETKHPDADYDSRNEQTKAPEPSPAEAEAEETPAAGDEKPVATTENQAKDEAGESSLTQQSIQVQSITGLAQERFQLTGEYSRANGNKVLMTTRIEQTAFEQLKSNFFRLTVAHQWVWSSFQMRVGIGMQYFVMSGKDLDGEKIDQAGVQPASDVGFYWRL